MQIFHIVGTMCSGKSHLIQYLMDTVEEDCAKFDIMEDFYVPNNVFREDGTMSWKQWEKIIPKLPKALNKFFDENTAEVVFIESFGTGQELNKYLKNKEHTVLCLEIPEDKVLKERAEQRGTSKDVLDNSTKYFRRNAYRLPKRQTYEEIDEAVRVALGYPAS